ncbi:MAG: ribonuclease D [Woeseiaceae bacterium]
MTDFDFVDLADDTSLARLVAAEERIGVDTEFMREKTFFSELCLIQVAAGKQIVCADPMPLAEAASARKNALWRAITKPTWVLHSGRQDIEVIYQTSGIMPAALFDTQVAAAILGYQPQIGYAGLVSELFGIELAKSHTRADWSRRPLADSVLNYAAEDVKYLLPACDELTERLHKLGRYQWVIEDSTDLLDAALYEPAPEVAIERLKGARNMRGRERAAAGELAEWREREALRTNRPRQWIMRDSVLLDIAITQPATLGELGNIQDLAESTVRRAGKKLLKIVETATHDKSNYRPPERPGEREKSLLKKMQKTVSDAAESLGIATEIVAPKKELSAALHGEQKSRVFRGWRREIVGDSLAEILNNE